MSRTTVSKGWGDRETRALITERDNLKVELRALLAEREAWRQKEQKLIEIVDVYAPGWDSPSIDFIIELQSILNATLSGGEKNE